MSSGAATPGLDKFPSFLPFQFFDGTGSPRSLLRRDLRGRTRMPSVSSVQSAENAWITSSSSTSATCAASYRAIFNTITTPERTSRSARTARGRVAYNLLPQATSLPSLKLAACIIAMSVEPLRGGLHAHARTLPTATTSILSKDREMRSISVTPPAAAKRPTTSLSTVSVRVASQSSC
jgi:hypothetical protein